MYAELIINIEAPLQGTFHYFVPSDMRRKVRVGHLVEVAFGQRQAQGVIVALTAAHPPDLDPDTLKPLIALIDPKPVVWDWQIGAAQWLSEEYLAPLNGSLRLFLPPGLTRWADVTVAINKYWDGTGRLTELQTALMAILREHGDMRGRKLRQLLPKKWRKEWPTAVTQLAKRDILIKATVLDPPRMKPKKLNTAELSAAPHHIIRALPELGRASKTADILHYFATQRDPLPAVADLLAATGASEKHLEQVVELGYVKLMEDGWAEGQRGGGAEENAPNPKSKIQNPKSVALAVPHKSLRRLMCEMRKATVYDDVLNLLTAEARPVPISEITTATKATRAHLNKLANLDLIRYGAEEVWRDPLADKDYPIAEQPLLTTDQARIWGRVKVALLEARSNDFSRPEAEEKRSGGAEGNAQLPITNYQSPILLHGVTGSGKTEIYMRAIDWAVQNDQQAIVLVPEIALTPQTVRRFAARFPGRVAILHSRLSDGERYDTWRRAREGLFDIVVGPRSALFVPFPNLGVIVVDEEHDPSYKQTPPVPPPYYHARELAIKLGELTGALVILGSATPDLVSYHRAKSGRYQLLELPRRVMGHRQRIASQESRLQLIGHYIHDGQDPDDALTIPLPPIEVVDLRQELRAGNRSIFSRALQTALDETLARGEQAILFLNRRGTNSFVICRDCGHTLKCPKCAVPLTYHRPGLLLACHHCGHKEPQPSDCPNCGSKRIKYFGLGTEELEEQVAQRWPEARIVRWDRDTTAGRDAHENLLASFINHESDVLVGTQMIAKGLDLPLVTLVGIVSADVSLGLPDYRTGERAFQLLAQVAGRAGRGLLGGKVILQTYQPEHYAIKAAAEHDFISFYLEEIRFRTQHGLPPFRRLARLEVVHYNSAVAEKEATKLATDLRWHILEKKLSATEILGPHPPFFGQIDGRYRWQIIIRAPNPRHLLADFAIPRGWVVDIDPVSTL